MVLLGKKAFYIALDGRSFVDNLFFIKLLLRSRPLATLFFLRFFFTIRFGF